MSYELHSHAGGEFKWNQCTYPMVLSLARAYGWQPEGTTNPPWGDGYWSEENAKNWDGRYCSNDLQIVSDADTANLARALERALEDLPATAKRFVYTGTELLDPSDKTKTQNVDLRDDLSNLIEYTGTLRDFISFLKKGSYNTW